MRRVIATGTIGLALIAGGCHQETGERQSMTVAQEAAPTLAPTEPAPASSPEPSTIAPAETIPSAEPTPAKPSSKNSLSSITLSNCDTGAKYDNTPEANGFGANRVHFNLDIDPGKLFWGPEYRPDMPVPSVCKLGSYTLKSVANNLLMTLERRTGDAEPLLAEEDVQFFDSDQSPSQSKRSSPSSLLAIDATLTDGAITLSTETGHERIISCNSKLLSTERVCKDDSLGAKEILADLLGPDSELSGSFKSSSIGLFLQENGKEKLSGPNQTVAVISLRHLIPKN